MYPLYTLQSSLVEVEVQYRLVCKSFAFVNLAVVRKNRTHCLVGAFAAHTTTMLIFIRHPA